MKRSKQIVLLLSGALATMPSGCTREQPRAPVPEPPRDVTNIAVEKEDDRADTPANGPGAVYDSAPYQAWSPHSWNYSRSGGSYYNGGGWHVGTNTAPSFFRPARPNIYIVPSGRSVLRAFSSTQPGISHPANPRSSWAPTHSAPSSHFSSPSITRGGFGGSAHGASS